MNNIMPQVFAYSAEEYNTVISAACDHTEAPSNVCAIWGEEEDRRDK